MTLQIRFGIGQIVCQTIALGAPLLVLGGAAAAQQRAPEFASSPKTTAIDRNGGSIAAPSVDSHSNSRSAMRMNHTDFLARKIDPPAGTPLTVAAEVGRRLNQRLGLIAVQRSTVGKRIGGGSDSPSQEAVSTDPRDSFESFVVGLSDPKRTVGN